MQVIAHIAIQSVLNIMSDCFSGIKNKNILNRYPTFPLLPSIYSAGITFPPLHSTRQISGVPLLSVGILRLLFIAALFYCNRAFKASKHFKYLPELLVKRNPIQIKINLYSYNSLWQSMCQTTWISYIISTILK